MVVNQPRTLSDAIEVFNQRVRSLCTVVDEPVAVWQGNLFSGPDAIVTAVVTPL
jgi:hypothetical protein